MEAKKLLSEPKVYFTMYIKMYFIRKHQMLKDRVRGAGTMTHPHDCGKKSTKKHWPKPNLHQAMDGTSEASTRCQLLPTATAWMGSPYPQMRRASHSGRSRLTHHILGCLGCMQPVVERPLPSLHLDTHLQPDRSCSCAQPLHGITAAVTRDDHL